MTTDTPAFMASFERWRVAITSLTVIPPRPPLRCESENKWESGKIMQAESVGGAGAETPEKTESELKQDAKECKRCERWRDELVRESPIVRFLLQHIALLPPAPGTEDVSTDPDSPTTNLPLPIACRPCPPTLAGGFSPSLGILLCQNRFMSKKHMEDAMAHELVHAWDGRRFEVKGEWGEDLRAHACTEIRAENLSGDCRWGRELTRRNFSFAKQHQTCVRRRAILSVAANPNCISREEAERAVNEVWESCSSDTRPFDEIY